MKAILFDLDGTLIDSSEGITKSTQYALAYYGIDEPDLSQLRVFIGPPLASSFEKYYNFDKEKAVSAVWKYRERYLEIGIWECELYPGVREALETLKRDGYLIGIASSKPENSCKRILDHFGILELFDEVVGATDDGRIDTKEEVLNEVMRRWSGIDKSDMCLVGDTIYDVEGAAKVGISSIGVSFGFGDCKEMIDGGAVSICNSMADVVSCIKGLL